MTRVVVALLALALLAAPLGAEGQPATRLPRVGLLLRAAPGLSPNLEAFRQGLRELGYAEGKNIILEYRYAAGNDERLRALAAELVEARVDVIVAVGSLAIEAARQATRDIPIVIAYTSDPVESGWAASLAHPGGNVTGLSGVATELAPKRVELLREFLPGASRVAVLSYRASRPSAAQASAMESPARALGLTLHAWDVDGPGWIAAAFAAIAEARMDGLVVVHSALMSAQRREIVELAAKHRLPAMYPFREYCEAGGLLAYGPSMPDMFRRTANYVAKILKGAKPGDLPIEQPTKFELVVNLKTAKALGLTVPPSVLLRADEVIQ